jgi:hypothetical protein
MDLCNNMVGTQEHEEANPLPVPLDEYAAADGVPRGACTDGGEGADGNVNRSAHKHTLSHGDYLDYTFPNTLATCPLSHSGRHTNDSA